MQRPTMAGLSNIWQSYLHKRTVLSCACHRTRKYVMQLIYNTNNDKRPDLNPIENLFGTLKVFMKDLNNDSFIAKLCNAIQLITPQQCFNWFRHCGYAI